jgi:hypothetical protein
MEQYMTPEEAAHDFFENVFPVRFPKGARYGRDYNRAKQLLYALRGSSRRAITSSWIRSVLDEYAPGRYVWRQFVTLNDENPQP